MNIVVIGGSGRIGKLLTASLQRAGHQVRSASRASGVDAVTGQGLDAALAGSQVVVDVTNSPAFDQQAVLDFFRSSTRNLLAAGARAGVGHHVVLSIVGADGLPDSGYLRAKAAQEALIQAGAVPWTIVRATQFFEFLLPIANANTTGQTVRLPSALMQPIAAADVAAALADTVGAPPANGIHDLAGPQAFALDALIRRVLLARQDGRAVATDAEARYFGARLAQRSLVPLGVAQLGATTLEQWLAGPPGA